MERQINDFNFPDWLWEIILSSNSLQQKRAHKMTTIPTGRYRHYKNKEYEVLGLARHSETEEELVVYRTLYGNFDLWVRPLAMFTETVMVDGVAVPRFRYIGADEGA